MYSIDYTNIQKEKLSIKWKNKAIIKEKQNAQTEDNIKH